MLLRCAATLRSPLGITDICISATETKFCQIVFCAAARTPLTVDVRRVEEQGVANLAAALQVHSPAWSPR